jgi:hypothetical protein
MTKYQLWSRDEYGQGSILMTSEDVNEVIKRAKREVTDVNVNNALTSTDRETNWEAYFVDLVNPSEKNEIKYVYRGLDLHTDDRVYKINENEEVELITLKNIPEDININIYLGDISTDRKKEIDWVGSSLKPRPIRTVDSPELAHKTFLFIKKI